MVTTLTGQYSSTVTLDQGGVGSQVTVADTATIQLGFNGNDGIFAPSSVTGAYVGNYGFIEGGADGGTATAGAGVFFANYGDILNYATIEGGTGGGVPLGIAFDGGIGVELAGGGHLTNLYVSVSAGGTIVGGAGGGGHYGGAGGDGALDLRSGEVANYDAISGGAGGLGSAQGGAGGTGVAIFGAGSLQNGVANSVYSPTIFGGEAGYGGGDRGGAGVTLSDGASAANFGLIAGGTAHAASAAQIAGSGGYGLLGLSGGLINNYGRIGGGSGGDSEGGTGGSGGTGVLLEAGAGLYNHGTIIGGYGGAGYTQGAYGGEGGIGLDIGTYNQHTLGSIDNFGEIRGGAGGAGTAHGGNGNAGVYMNSGASLDNFGEIDGGAGGAANNETVYGNGGAGVSLKGGTLINGASIFGGAGSGYGNAGAGVYVTGGAAYNDQTITGGESDAGNGGAGAVLRGGMLGNYATITGGQSETSGKGGAGVYLDGGTLTTSGTISGGLGGSVQADAVLFGTAAATLILKPGAVFHGQVAANAADTLDLGTDHTGSLTGLGVQFTGFGTINLDDAGFWTLGPVAGGKANTASASETLNINEGTLSVTGVFKDLAKTTIFSESVLQAAGSGVLQVENLSLAGGALACGSKSAFAIGTTTTGASAGTITIDSGATLTGYGAIQSALAGSGDVDVAAGRILDVGAVGGSISFTVATGGTLAMGDGGGFAHGIGGAGTLDLYGTTPYTLTTSSAISVAALTIAQAKVVLTGAGTIAGKLANYANVDGVGTVTASGGIFTIGGAATGSGDFGAASGATLDFAGGVTTAGTISGAGTVEFAGTSVLDAGVTLTAAHVVQSAALILGGSTNLALTASQAFVIDAAAGATVKLSGAGGDKLTNAGSLSASGPGTADIAVSFANSKTVSAGSGTLSFLGSVTNTGTIAAGAGTLDFSAKVDGTGSLTLGTGTLSLLDGAASGQSLQFQDSTGLLDLTNPLSFGGSIADFAAGDKIDLLNTASTGFTFSAGVLKIEDGTTTVASLKFAGSDVQSDFAIGPDGHGGTMITFT